MQALQTLIDGREFPSDSVLVRHEREVMADHMQRMHDGTRSFVPWDGEFEALYAPGGILAEASGDVPPNVEFSGVPVGHSINHPAGGTSAGTQGYASGGEE